MEAGLEEVLEFRENLVHVCSQLDLKTSALLHDILTEASEVL